MPSLAEALAPARWDVVMSQGSSWEAVLDFEDTPLAGIQFRGYLARRHRCGVALTAYAFDRLTGGNRVRVSLTAEQTAALPHGLLVHDIEAYTDQGWVLRFLEGTVTVTPEVTA